MLKNFIDGAWVSSNSSQSTPVLNPANAEKLADCPAGNAHDVDHAVRAARAAFKTWRETPATERVQYLFKMKVLLEQHAQELAELVTKENGKTLVEARGSVKRGIQMVETACGIPSLMMGEAFEDIASGIDCIAMKRPMGVFAMIAPFNFPAMVPFWFWPFAVATGNTFIIKPSERVPLTQARVFELMEEAGFPKGVLNLVNGGKDVVEAILKHPDIVGVSFVGSTPVAKIIYEGASKSGKRVQALGGAKNVMVVMPDALMDSATKTALESIVGCAGERCLAGSVVVCVGDKTYAEVKERMTTLARDISIGDGLDPHTQMGPVISQASKDRIKGLIAGAIKDGAKVLVDGRDGVDHLKGYFLKPTVLADIQRSMTISKEEVFGPVVLLAKVDKFDDAIAWVNEGPFANTTTLFTTSGPAARKFMYEADPSMIGINIGVPAPMSFFSFGGAKESFFGDIKVHGKAAIDFFTDTKVTTQRWLKDSSIW